MKGLYITENWDRQLESLPLSTEERSSHYEPTSVLGKGRYIPKQKQGWIFKGQELGGYGICES